MLAINSDMGVMQLASEVCVSHNTVTGEGKNTLRDTTLKIKQNS